MGEFETLALAGFGLGLSSSMHCGAMCGGICGSALVVLAPQTPRERWLHVAGLQIGRVCVYVMIGVIGASLGGSVIPADAALRFRILQWVGAVSLMWAGLTVAGYLPRIALLDRGALYLAEGIRSLSRRWGVGAGMSSFLLGAAWALNACPMVYAAAFTSSMTGSWERGALFMGAFGLGTVPAVVFVSLGLSVLAKGRSNPAIQSAAGLMMAFVAFASLYAPWQRMIGICLPQ